MTEVRRHNEVAIRERLPLAHKAGELPKWLNVDKLRPIHLYAARWPIHPSGEWIDRERNLDGLPQMALRHLG